MAFKTILVSLNHEERVPELVAAAAQLARPAEAHVIGLFVMPPLFMPSDVIMPMGSEFYDQQIAEHRAQAERIKAKFEALTKGDTYIAEWRVQGDERSAYESIADGVIAQARSVEIVIVSQACDGVAPPMLTDLPQRLALESGRPVLIVPVAWKPQAIGANVAIAWNDSREAARALFDALPVLRGAQSVQVITVADKASASGTTTLVSADIAATLARFGLKVDVDIADSARGGPAATLMGRAAAHGADLLVMGAYGHSRMREFILGGATRDVLKNMTIPVVMSH